MRHYLARSFWDKAHLREAVTKLALPSIVLPLSLNLSAWLWLDSRVVDVPMASNPPFVTLSSVKLCLCNGLHNA